MPEDDPRRMEEIRKYAAIYGRFDCKRKPEKPLTLHEVRIKSMRWKTLRMHLTHTTTSSATFHRCKKSPTDGFLSTLDLFGRCWSTSTAITRHGTKKHAKLSCDFFFVFFPQVSVNEAAAQICRFAPALLTRRDELFPLARQVVRDSGYHYSKTQAR